MLVFRGYGLLVLVFTFGCSMIANFIVNEVVGSEDYWDEHLWLLGIPLVCSGGLCWLSGRTLFRRSSRRLIDPETAEEVILTDKHDFFWIRMDYWGVILAGLGVIAFVWGSISEL